MRRTLCRGHYKNNGISFRLLWVFLTVFLWLLLRPETVFAAAYDGIGGEDGQEREIMDELRLIKEDPVQGFRYEWESHGGFYTNVLKNGSQSMAYFILDEGLECILLKDGESRDFNPKENLLFEVGEYLLYLTSREVSYYVEFPFRLTGAEGQDALFPGGAGESGGWADLFSGIGIREGSLLLQYDGEDEYLRYSEEQSGRSVLKSNVPDGAVCAGKVYMEPAENVIQTIYRNGEYLAGTEDHSYSEPGRYECRLMIYSEDTKASTENYIIETRFRFQIAGAGSTEIGVVSSPEGFALEKVVLDGVQQPEPEKDWYFLERDGSYELTYRSLDKKELTFTTALFRDTCAPFLEFDKEIDQGAAKAPLSFSSTEEDSHCEIRRNSLEYQSAPNAPITMDGVYRIRVSDRYGNSRIYTVRVYANYQFFSPGMLALLAMATAAAAVVMLRARNTYSIR